MSWRDIDWSQYAPTFSSEEEDAAREEGYESALERWEVDMDFKHWAHYHDSVPKRGRAQVESDLNSIGVPYERLGSLSRAANALPASPDYIEPEPAAPKDPAVRAGRIHGIQRHVAELMDAFEKHGVHWQDATSEESSCPESARHLHAKWDMAANRLSALGENISEMAHSIESGETEITEFVNVEIPPEDPELRRVYEAHKQQIAHEGGPDTEDADSWADETGADDVWE